MSGRIWHLSSRVLLGVLAGLVLLSTPFLRPIHRVDSLEASAPAPQNLEDLLADSSLILVGEVGPLSQYLDFAVYGGDGQLLAHRPLAADGSPQGDIPATDYVLKVERVIRDDGSIAGGGQIVLRLAGHITEDMKNLPGRYDNPFSFPGDQYLFLLTPTPDGKAYGYNNGAWSRLIVDDQVLRISNYSRDLLQFDDDRGPITLDEFVDAVKSRDSQ